MKVLIVHDPYSPIKPGSVGGEDNLVDLEVKELIKIGVEIFDFRKFDSGLNRKFNQIRANTFGSVRELNEQIQYFKPDVIHTHNMNQRSGYKWMNYTKLPIVSSLHNFRIFCPASIAWRNGKHCFECRDVNALQAIKHKCGGKDGFINSSRLELFQRNQPQLKVPKIFLTGSEMMNEALSPIISEEKLRILRNPGLPFERSAVPKKRIGWLAAGRFTPEKGFLELIESWPEDEKLDIAGNGPLREKIEEMIRNRLNINLIGTFSPGTNDIYQQYEGLVFPSTWIEGSPLVVIDAISCGTPVICSNQSSASEQVKLTECGVVIEGEFERKKIENAISKIRNEFESLSNSGLSVSSEKFSIEKWSNDLLKYLVEASEL